MACTGKAKMGELGTAEKLLVWSGRMWANNHQHGHGVSKVLENAFTNFGVDGVDEPLCAFFTELAAADGTPIRFRPPNCGRMSEDEAALLSVFSQMQNGEAVIAMQGLSRWMTQSQARIAVTHMFSVVEAFARNGLTLERKCDMPQPKARQAVPMELLN